jgi:hypothetical protein
MSAQVQDIQRLLREAAANEVAAARHEDRYEAQLKAAGANVYHAFAIALRASPEFSGRQIDDKAIARIYTSPKPRPWWDKHLATVRVDGKPATREWGKRLIQWHLDPEAAQARRAQHTIALVAGRKKLQKQRTAESRGSRETPKASRDARLDVHAARVSAASERAALGGRELQNMEKENVRTLAAATRDTAVAIIGRLATKVKRVPEGALSDLVDSLVSLENDFNEALS